MRRTVAERCNHLRAHIDGAAHEVKRIQVFQEVAFQQRVVVGRSLQEIVRAKGVEFL